MKKILLFIFVCGVIVATTVPSHAKFDFTDPESKAEYDEFIETKGATELTEKQIEEGYQLLDGVIYAPGELDGEASRLQSVEIVDGVYNPEAESVTIKSNNGYVTFQAFPDEEIHETCFVQVMNIRTYEEFAFYLYETNYFTTSVELPYGNYVISGGGTLNDYKNEYPIENVNFEVKKSASSYVKFSIGEEDNAVIKDVEIILKDGSSKESEVGVIQETFSKWSVFGYIFIGIIAAGFVSLILFMVYFKIKRNR